MAMRNMLTIDNRVPFLPLPDRMIKGIIACMIYSKSGDDRHRRKETEPGRKPRGAELVKSAHLKSANRTNYAALPLAA